MSQANLVLTDKITRHRVHVERLISQIKDFKVLSHRIAAHLFPKLNQVWSVCCYISLFQGYVLKKTWYVCVALAVAQRVPHYHAHFTRISLKKIKRGLPDMIKLNQSELLQEESSPLVHLLSVCTPWDNLSELLKMQSLKPSPWSWTPWKSNNVSLSSCHL